MNAARLLESREGPYRVASLVLDERCDPKSGSVRWDPARSLWNGDMIAASVVLGPVLITPAAVLVFLLLLAMTMCAGHSVGFHRRLIHRTFQCARPLERVLVWFGVLVGMQGPFWVIRSHDLRDWAQRQPDCHAFLKHGGSVWLDGVWNLHCRLELTHGPRFDPGPNVPWASIPSMGESWHNNHHAFPASARHGLYPGDLDLGYEFLCLLAKLGWVSGVQTPYELPPRYGLTALRADAHSIFVDTDASAEGVAR